MRRQVLTELSALGFRKSINPMLPKLIEKVEELRQTRHGHPELVVDSGCGQLRHLNTLLESFTRLCLVDTEIQLESRHLFDGKKQSIREFINANHSKRNIKILSNRQFALSTMSAGVIFSVNVLDVTPPEARREILESATKNLSRRGLFASIVPRNDSRTLALCQSAQKYKDGHIFRNKTAFTFYRNWSNEELVKLYRKYSLEVVLDLSNYRYACMICKLV